MTRNDADATSGTVEDQLPYVERNDPVLMLRDGRPVGVVGT